MMTPLGTSSVTPDRPVNLRAAKQLIQIQSSFKKAGKNWNKKWLSARFGMCTCIWWSFVQSTINNCNNNKIKKKQLQNNSRPFLSKNLNVPFSIFAWNHTLVQVVGHLDRWALVTSTGQRRKLGSQPHWKKCWRCRSQHQLFRTYHWRILRDRK